LGLACELRGPPIDEEYADFIFRTLKRGKNATRGGKFKVYWTIRKQWENRGRLENVISMQISTGICV
jgi:hypothetical protein